MWFLEEIVKSKVLPSTRWA